METRDAIGEAPRATKSKSIYLSVIMPAFNEEASIEPVVYEHLAVLRRLSDVLAGWELLCLVDCSTDRTGQILAYLADLEVGVRVLRNSHNAGIFHAFERLAQAAAGTHVYMTASDGQWPAVNLERMLRLTLAKGPDLVIGVRTNKHDVYTLRRRLVSGCFNLLPEVVFGVRTSDAGSIKFGRREVFTLPLVSHGAFREAERIILARRLRYRVEFVPIVFRARAAGAETGARWSNVVAGVWDCVLCARAYGIALPRATP
jgi:glycosyltransferase involved in cell wall biosynthesis